MILSDHMLRVVASEVPEARRAVLLEAFSALDESIFGRQDLDRMAASIVILFLGSVEISAILNEVMGDRS
ncbi:hypothetical protein [Streptomyces sp. NPDC046909]|uniref:hypothetical protein n=1 Tax=Streptomyces sp. NPDC046909 TaxID=3155617 RepID=UPI0034037A4F